MKRIVFASGNRGKVAEIGAMLSGMGIELRSLADYPGHPAIVEDGASFLENALLKARRVSQWTGEVALADDSGIEVEALGGEPGIRSARYAGKGATDAANIDKLLERMAAVPPEDRKAAFHCALVLYRPEGRWDSFEGRWEGRITEAATGEGGFGYDPIFYLPDRGVTVAQLPPEEKNRISHRAQAFAELRAHLQRLFKTDGA